MTAGFAGFPCATAITRKLFHSQRVTSALAVYLQLAHHCQGKGSRVSPGKNARKSFVVKILTPKPLALKILQTIFAKPAPSKLFRGWGRGGTP